MYQRLTAPLTFLHCSCRLLVLSSTGQSQYPLQVANTHRPIGTDLQHGGSCSKKGLVDVQTSRTKRKFADIQQEILHDTTAGSMPNPFLGISGASPTGNFSVLCCSSVRQQMQMSCKFQTQLSFANASSWEQTTAGEHSATVKVHLLDLVIWITEHQST